jgi:hypothetical protein
VATELDNPAPDDRDLVVGGPGDDSIGLSEGADRVTCFGPVDPLDELVGCERVRVLD